jgi:hypothetical protein
MSNKTAVVHSDPDILGGTPVFVGVYRCGICSTILNEDIASTSFLTLFHRFLESKPSRPLRPRMRF